MKNTVLKDADIREPLFDFLEESYGKVRIIEEKTMGSSRADVVMVTEDALYGLEIKSDADSYTRLEGQVKDYDKYYDYNIAVVGTSHAMHIREHVPSYWGVITVEYVDNEFDFYILRKPERNPKLSPERKLQILWRPELAHIQELNLMPKYKDKSKDYVIKKIIERTKLPDDRKGRIDISKLNIQISEVLFERDYNTVEETLKEYRKGEIQKKLEAETDPQKKLELMVEQAAKGRLITQKSFKKRRRRKR
ncbi:MAG: sce7726 family protein [Lachnospiraceae bacterium]|nr:sce7726 family protein [Lachnospiraceae bacterium]